MFFQRRENVASLRVGTRIRIRESRRSPYSGRLGIIAKVDPSDAHGTYVVQFDDGTQYRYNAAEIETQPHNSPASPSGLVTHL